MVTICRNNCGGKTKELIKESLDTGVPILAINSRKAQSLKEKSMAYFGEIVPTVEWEDAKSYKRNVLIDDVDKVIPVLLQESLKNYGISVAGLTISM